MHIPILGEVTAMRAFFLFLFFYSNDSNNLSTWSTFGAGMLLSNLMDLLKTPKIDWKQVAPQAAFTFFVLGYASLYLEQARMMIFLSLQSLFVPFYKIKVCRQMDEAGNGEILLKPLMGALTLLMCALYGFDGLSGLTSGVLFLIYMPEITQRLPPFPAARTVLFMLLVIVCCAPVGVVVIGAVYFEKEVMTAPEQYRTWVKMAVGARPESVPDYYKIVGVSRKAEPGEIKKVFRELSKIYHPDKTDGHPELQAKFVEISDAVRKLTGKGSDREAYFRELENAELQDMITRCIYFCLLFGLWFVMTALQWAGQRKPEAEGGEEGAMAAQAAANKPPPKPKAPMTRMQWAWILLSIPVFYGWFEVENMWADLGGADMD